MLPAGNVCWSARLPAPRGNRGVTRGRAGVGENRGVTGRPPSPDAGLEAFHRLPEDAAAARLTECLAVPRWVGAVLAGRPYPVRGALLAAARILATGIDDAELGAALARHPRIGERPAGDDREAELSRSEQSAVDGGDAALTAALAAGNREYEERFGHVFLIRAAGRSGPEVLAALRQRLGNRPAVERDVVRGQLAEIAVLRLEQLLEEGAR